MPSLTTAVDRPHGAKTHFIGSLVAHERRFRHEPFQSAAVRRGAAPRIALDGHAAAKQCYACSVPAAPNNRERFNVVLRAPEVNSPDLALDAAMIADHRGRNG